MDRIKNSESRNEITLKNLAVFTSFNVRCRYSKDKIAFYKICNREFSEPYFKEAGELILWLKKFYQEEK